MQYVIVSDKSDLGVIMGKIKGRLKYEKILKYEYIIEGLNKFKKLKIENYILFNNTEFVNREIDSAESARLKL